MEYTTRAEKKSRVKDVNESELSELERPKSPSFDLTRQRSLDQEKRNLEQILEEKCKELEKINQYAHSLEDLGSKKSKNENVRIELVKHMEEAKKEQRSIQESNGEIKQLLLGLENKHPKNQLRQLDNQLKQLVDQSGRVKDQDKDTYDQSGLKNLLQMHRERLQKEITFMNTQKCKIDSLKKDLQKDVEYRDAYQKDAKREIYNFMECVDIRIKVDWDAYFDRETPIQIESIDDCHKFISEVESEFIGKQEERIMAIDGKEFENAQDQLCKTRLMVDYLEPIGLIKPCEQVKTYMIQAINHESERKRWQKMTCLDNGPKFKAWDEFKVRIDDADKLIINRKERQAKEAEASKNVQVHNNPYAEIMSRCLKDAMDVVEAVKSRKMSHDNLYKKLDEDRKTSMTNLLIYCKNEGIRMVNLPGYHEIQRLYTACGNEICQCQKVVKRLTAIEAKLQEFRNKVEEGPSWITQEHKEEFESKLVNLIKSHADTHNTFFIPKASKIGAIITFYDSISKKLPDSLKSQLEKNKEAEVEKRAEIAKLRQASYEATSQGQDLQKQITQIEQEAKNGLMKGAPSRESSKDIQSWLTQRHEELQAEVERTTRQLESLRTRVKQSQEVAMEAKNASSSRTALEMAHERDENQKLFEDLMVKTLQEVYYEKYKKEVDCIQAHNAACYLNELNLVGGIERQAIEAAAHLIQHFDATFQDVYMNSETHEIVIVKPSDTKDSNLSKVEFDQFGRLKIDRKKQKSFVMVSPEEMPDVLILPVKAEMAYGSAAFAGGTPMLPGGTAGIEDLRDIKNNHMNILAIAAEREFKEETQGKYQLVEGTLKYVTGISRMREDACFFEAKAKPTTTVIDTQACAETKDTVLLNIMDVIRENKLDTYCIPSRREFTMKQAILKEAQRQRPDLIAKVPEKEADFRDGPEGEPQWRQYFTAYCTDHLVDYMKKRIPECSKQRQEIRYRLRGSGDSSWRTLSDLVDQGVRGSESANWRAQDSEGLNRGVERSESANWRERGSSSSAANS